MELGFSEPPSLLGAAGGFMDKARAGAALWQSAHPQILHHSDITITDAKKSA